MDPLIPRASDKVFFFLFFFAKNNLYVTFFFRKIYVVGTQQKCSALKGTSNKYSQHLFVRNKKNFYPDALLSAAMIYSFYLKPCILH